MMPIIKFHPDTYGSNVCVNVCVEVVTRGALETKLLPRMLSTPPLIHRFTGVELRFNIPVVSLTQECNNLAWKTFYVHSIFADYDRWIPFKVSSHLHLREVLSVCLSSWDTIPSRAIHATFGSNNLLHIVQAEKLLSLRSADFPFLVAPPPLSSAPLYECDTLVPIPSLHTWELYSPLSCREVVWQQQRKFMGNTNWFN